MEARAFCPGHISTFFVPRVDESAPLEQRGSLGSGFCIAEGVTTTVKVHKGAQAGPDRGPSITFTVADNGEKLARPSLTVAMLGQLFGKVERGWPEPGVVEIRNEYRLPIGAGFGVSGALALAGALATNKAMGLRLSRNECVEAAHVAEVLELTGLGDVAAQSVGGFEIRTREGPPPHGRLLRPETAATGVVLASFGPRPTRAFLENPKGKEALASAGERSLAELQKDPSLKASTRLGRRFAEELGLVSPEAANLMKGLGARTPASVAMLGNSVFALGGNAVFEKARALAPGAFVMATQLDKEGARLL